MKKLMVLLFFAQFLCLSQTAQVKRASDACPGSNNKSSTSNDYAYLSKRSSAKDNSNFSKPKYQSIYAKKTVVATESKRGKSAASVEKTVSAKTEKRVIEKQEVKNTPTVVEEKNTSSKSTREPEFEPALHEGTKSEEPKPVEINKTEIIETEVERPIGINKTEITGKEEAKPTELNKAETKDAPKPILEKGKSASSKKEKKSLETSKENNKQQRKQFIKKIKVGKNNATDCPEF